MNSILYFLNKAKQSESGFILEKFELSEEAIISQISEINPILQYGKFEHWIVQDDGKDLVTNISKTSQKFTPHVDGISLPNFPNWISLFAVDGSEMNNMSTYLVDTTKYLENLPRPDREILENLDFTFVDKDGTLYTNKLVKTGTSGKPYIHMTGRGFFVPRYTTNEQYTTKLETYDYISVVNAMNVYLLDEKNWDFSTMIKKNEVLVFDNQRYIHGRVNHTNERDLKRKLIRIYS